MIIFRKRGISLGTHPTASTPTWGGQYLQSCDTRVSSITSSAIFAKDIF